MNHKSLLEVPLLLAVDVWSYVCAKVIYLHLKQDLRQKPDVGVSGLLSGSCHDQVPDDTRVVGDCLWEWEPGTSRTFSLQWANQGTLKFRSEEKESSRANLPYQSLVPTTMEGHPKPIWRKPTGTERVC